MFLDGSTAGQALSGDSLPGIEPGSHTIKVTARGYEDFKTTGAVPRGERKTIAVTLTKPGAAAASGRAAPPRAAANTKAPTQQKAPAVELPPPISIGLPSCTGDWTENYNQDNMCFDARPRSSVATVLAVPDEIPGSPTAPILRVWVTAEGTVTQVVRVKDSSVPQFTLAAINFVKGIKFNPAQKDSKPVAAWASVQVLPSGR